MYKESSVTGLAHLRTMYVGTCEAHASAWSGPNRVWWGSVAWSRTMDPSFGQIFGCVFFRKCQLFWGYLMCVLSEFSCKILCAVQQQHIFRPLPFEVFWWRSFMCIKKLERCSLNLQCVRCTEIMNESDNSLHSSKIDCSFHKILKNYRYHEQS